MSLSSIIQSTQTGFLKRVLTGAGVGITAGTVTYTAFQQAVNAVHQQTYGLGGDIIALLHIAGFDIFLTMILTATATYLTLQQTKLTLSKIK